jgi:aryl-alcohol dehydrogenase-like predicted oxidoreductase
VLSRGLLAGSRPRGSGDFRAFLPRFRGGNLEANEKLAGVLKDLAAEKSATAAQLAIAWVLAQDATIVPVIGARTRSQLQESLGALSVALTPDDLRRIAEAVPAGEVAGSRYDENQMKMLDSER